MKEFVAACCIAFIVASTMYFIVVTVI